MSRGYYLVLCTMCTYGTVDRAWGGPMSWRWCPNCERHSACVKGAYATESEAKKDLDIAMFDAADRCSACGEFHAHYMGGHKHCIGGVCSSCPTRTAPQDGEAL